MLPRRSLALVTAAATTAAVMSVSGSQAVAAGTTVGELFTPVEFCSDQTTLFIAHDTPGYALSNRGVVTSYRIRLAVTNKPTSVAFRLARVDASTVRIVSSAPLVETNGVTQVQGNVRIPAQAGDVLGAVFVDDGGDPYNCATFTNVSTDRYRYRSGVTPTGSYPLTEFTLSNGYRFPIEATVEPDVDRDGYGDVTQDRCTTDPTTQGTCASSAPRTRIGKVRVRRNGKVILKLGANEQATFWCQVDAGRYRPCGSTFAKKLTPGRHTIKVVAVDRYGNRDASPAVKRVRVRRR